MVDPIIISQRIRNRIIEYLEFVEVVNAETWQLKTSDVVNLWEGYVYRPVSRSDFSTPTYTSNEVDALLAFDASWELFCDKTEPWPDSYPD